MPIILGVRTKLDEGSLDDVKRNAQSAFDGIGRDISNVLESGLRTGLQGALSGAVSEFGSFGKAAQSALSSIPEHAGAAALGIGGIVVAAAAAGKALYDLGATWDSITDSFTMATGRTGEDLQAFADVVGDVGSMTAASLGDIGKVVEQLVQQFPQLDMASESIRVMASDIATLNASGQNVNIHELGLAMRVFGVSAESGTKALDDFAAVSRATGTSVNQIISEVRVGAPIFKQFGMDMGEASSYLAAFDAAGVAGGSTMQGLRAALVGLAGDSRGSREALIETIAEIKRLYDAGEAYQAQQLAIETFGKRAFAPMLEAITSGALDLESLNKALDGTAMSIQEMKDATDDGKESWQELTNTVQTRFKPLADIVFNAVNDGAMLLTGNLTKVQGGFEVTADRAADLRDRMAEVIELQRQFQPDSPLGRMLLPAGVPGAPTLGGIGGPGGIGGSSGLGRDTGLGVNQGLGGFAPPTAGTSGGGSNLGPQVPYSADYTAGPLPGESAQQYSARMAQIEADHKVAQAQANVDAIKADNTHTAEQLQKAENDLAEAKQNAQQTQIRNAQAGSSGGIDVAIPYAPGFGTALPGETSQQYSARQAVLEAQHKSAEEIAKLNQMETSGVATQNDIINQKNKVLEAQRAQQAAEMRLNDAYSKQVEDATKGMDALGAGLDKDLGLSKGLAGLADNLVRFLGSLAAAPLMGQLNAISAAQGGASATGSGLIGMLGATGAFGPDYQVGGYDTTGKPYSMAALQGAGGGGGPGGGGRLTIGQVDQLAAQFGLTKTSGYRNEPGSFHATGLAGDYAGSPEQMDAFANFMALNYGNQLNELIHSGGGTQYNVYRGQLGPVIDQPGSVYNSGQAGYHGDHDHIAVGYGGGNMQGFAPGGRRSGSGPSGIANMIYSMARQRGYSDHDAQSIVAYAIGESSLNPMAGGGVQGGSGDPYADNVIGLFQQKPDFARAGGIDPTLRGDPYYNTLAYLNNLDRNRGMPIEQALPRTSVGGPLAPGGYQPWGPLMTRAGQLIDPNAINYGGQPQTYDTGGQFAGIVAGTGVGPPPVGPDGKPVNFGGAPQLHDAGLLGSSAGAIPPGTTVVQNNTGANEHIATPAQLGDIMGAGWGPGGRPPSPGVGNDGMGASSGKGDGPTQIGGSEPKSQNGASAGGGGGLFGAAVGAGSMAADAFAPGSGAAVQIAGQEIQRAIKAGGQFAGIVAGGLMETFLPTGASQIANDNWITRIGGAFAGMAPQLPNLAGKAPTPVPQNKMPGDSPMPLLPGTPGPDKQNPGGSPTFNLTLNSNGPIEDKHIEQLTGSLQRQYETGMAQVGGR